MTGRRRSIAGLVAFRLRWVLAQLAIVVSVAVLGYRIIEGYGWFDALYMTVITIGTVGYGETRPLGTGGRWFTIGLIATGFALAVHGVVALSNLIASGDLLRALRHNRMVRMTARLHHHVIVVGYGRVGRSVATALLRDGVPFIVVDRDPAVVERLRAGGHAALEGDGEQEDTLVAARIDSAAALVAAAPDDATNLVVVLSARALRPDLRVVARVDDPRWSNRLVKAGADVVRNPYEEFGANLAVSAVDTSVVGLHDLPGWGLRVEEIEVTAASSWAGRVAGELVAHLPGVLLMGLRSDRGVTRWHEVTGALSPGDVVVALGPPAAIERLRTTMAPAP